MSEVGTFSGIRREADKAPGLTLPTWVMAALATVPHGFTGRIELNCAHGNVANANVLWSIKPT